MDDLDDNPSFICDGIRCLAAFAYGGERSLGVRRKIDQHDVEVGSRAHDILEEDAAGHNGPCRFAIGTKGTWNSLPPALRTLRANTLVAGPCILCSLASTHAAYPPAPARRSGI